MKSVEATQAPFRMLHRFEELQRPRRTSRMLGYALIERVAAVLRRIRPIRKQSIRNAKGFSRAGSYFDGVEFPLSAADTGRSQKRLTRDS